jgi:hypothetical protein
MFLKNRVLGYKVNGITAEEIKTKSQAITDQKPVPFINSILLLHPGLEKNCSHL